MDDTAIHRVLKGGVRGSSVRLLGASGSPRPQGASDDNTLFVIGRRERSMGTRQSIGSRVTQTEDPVRLVKASGSPRAFSPRDDKVR